MSVARQIIEILDSDMLEIWIMIQNQVMWFGITFRFYGMGALKVSCCQSKHGRRGKQLRMRREARSVWAGLQTQLRAKFTGELIRVSCRVGVQCHMMSLCKQPM